MDLTEKYQRAFAAIQAMRLGKRVLRACREAGISRAQLYELAGQDPSVSAALKIAEDECDTILAESLVDAEEWGQFGAQDPKVATVWAKNAQWLLSKKNPARYGDKITVESKTTMDIVITSRLEAARARVLDLAPAPVKITDCSD